MGKTRRKNPKRQPKSKPKEEKEPKLLPNYNYDKEKPSEYDTDEFDPFYGRNQDQ